MTRIRTGAVTCLLAFLASLTLGACSVVRVDVDVYNGPLANHEEVQVEQLAAMVMGARPLLAQLRDTLQWHDACREPKDGESYSQCILRQKNETIAKGITCRERESVLVAVDSRASDILTCNLNHPAARVNELIKLYLDQAEPVTVAAKVAGDEAPVAGADPDNENFSAFKEQVATFEQQFLDLPETQSSMKETAAKITRMLDPIRTWDLLYQRRESTGFRMYNAIREVGNVNGPNIFDITVNDRERIMDRVLFFYGPDAARDLLELARIQPEILSSHDQNDKDGQQSVSSDLQKIEDATAGRLKAFYPRDRRGALQRGRLDEGLATLIENYLIHKRTCIAKFGNDCALHGTFRKYSVDKPIDAPSAARLMQEAIVRFANKLVTIADHEILLKRDGGSPQQFTGAAAQQLDENVLVLQAIGNSILAQADEIHRRRTHDVGIRDDFRKKAAIQSLATTYGINLDFDEGRNTHRTSANTVEVLDQLIERLKFMHIAAKAPRGSGMCEASTPTVASDGDGETKSEERQKEVKGKSSNSAQPAGSGELQAAQQAATGRPGNPDQSKSCNPRANGPEATQIEAAIKLAYEYRSGMVYIRPPSAYLRQVFAASGLQDGTAGAWRNMLEEQGARSLPFSGLFGFEGLRGENSNERQRRIRAEIDKQFWNNINSVRLAGFGATNFVLVKDDVGNWYAKNVEADPSQIYQSVQSSLLFAVGGNVNADLLLQRNLEREALEEKGGSYTKLLQNTEYTKLRDQNRKRFAGVESSDLTPAFVGFREAYVDAIATLGEDVVAVISADPAGTTGLAADLRNIATESGKLIPSTENPAVGTDMAHVVRQINAAFTGRFDPVTIGRTAPTTLADASSMAAGIEQATEQLVALRDDVLRHLVDPTAASGETCKKLRTTVSSATQALVDASNKLKNADDNSRPSAGKAVVDASDNLDSARTTLEDCENDQAAAALTVVQRSNGWAYLRARIHGRLDRTLHSWLDRQVAALDSFEQAVQVMAKVRTTAPASAN
ncbi:MAG: hypothetical protein DHS20C03_04510 [Minwuia thermotolerans]|nr:MAG: hypothetical protein DHS20C03_04510 [Minwuia thermotolerans]